MPKVILIGWKPGLRKISLGDLLQAKAGLTPKQAKDCVDRLLDGDDVVIDVSTRVNAEDLIKEASSLGAICTVED